MKYLVERKFRDSKFVYIVRISRMVKKYWYSKKQVELWFPLDGNGFRAGLNEPVMVFTNVSSAKSFISRLITQEQGIEIYRRES